MKELFDKITAGLEAAINAVKGIATPAAAACAACLLILAAPQGANGQDTGTYVKTRPQMLGTGTVTNQNVYTFTGTNFLNYSGFHRPGIWITTTNLNATPVGITLTIKPVQSFSGTLTNAFLYPATSTVTPTTAPISWFVQTLANSTNTVYTNLDWPWADSVAGWQIILTGTNSSAIQGYELDLINTP